MAHLNLNVRIQSRRLRGRIYARTMSNPIAMIGMPQSKRFRRGRPDRGRSAFCFVI
jgi:hypothetical protein